MTSDKWRKGDFGDNLLCLYANRKDRSYPVAKLDSARVAGAVESAVDSSPTDDIIGNTSITGIGNNNTMVQMQTTMDRPFTLESLASELRGIITITDVTYYIKHSKGTWRGLRSDETDPVEGNERIDLVAAPNTVRRKDLVQKCEETKIEQQHPQGLRES
eukprot:GHVU01102982.1.p1 GENE.GHVU01102982.1~~GHVU01102982.1.p1  ORF type:complete len:160 (-),score=17.63 GHVU01102982.1:161-640(-)